MQTWSADVCKLRSTNSVPGTSKIIKKIAKQSAARRQIVGGGGGGAPTNKCRRRRRGENRGGGGAARPAQGSNPKVMIIALTWNLLLQQFNS